MKNKWLHIALGIFNSTCERTTCYDTISGLKRRLRGAMSQKCTEVSNTCRHGLGALPVFQWPCSWSSSNRKIKNFRSVQTMYVAIMQIFQNTNMKRLLWDNHRIISFLLSANSRLKMCAPPPPCFLKMIHLR